MYKLLFSVALFLSASLLFVIQPVVAKVLLPFYGGTPSVWTMCMLFFQVLLLAAYGYAWLLSQLPGIRWRLVHLLMCLISFISLPLIFVPSTAQAIPELNIFLNLTLQLGLPLLIVAASAPLLQFAYSQTFEKEARDPYFLYVASNFGSLLALLMYPWMIERFLGVNQQFALWTMVYLVYLLILITLLCLIRYKPLKQKTIKKSVVDWRDKLIWVVLSFIPCSLMLGVTSYISTDIAATPLFWVIPLALYLLSFIVTFARAPIISHTWLKQYFWFVPSLPIISLMIGQQHLHVILLISINLFSFFILALLCHGELIHKRPDVSKLTTFYFCIALGGVIAGIFNGLLAPHLFSGAYEYLLILFLALFLFWSFRPIYYFCSMSILFLFVTLFMSNATQLLNQQRNFYGTKRVFSQSGAHVLMSQNTLHGFQVYDDDHPTDGARAYYGSVFPIIKKLQEKNDSLQALVLGLGIGTMACQFRSQDQLTVVEIDQQMIDIAKNPEFFTYLRDCSVQLHLIKNDGRLAVTQLPDNAYDVLVMDAFNSDAIPVHLLTQEAFALYQRKIKLNGVILVNITNRHLHILPVVTAAGRQLDMIVLHKLQTQNNQTGQFATEWALLTTNEQLAMQLLSKENWHFVADIKTQRWTDDYSNLIALLKW